MSQDLVLLDKVDAVACLTLNRPQQGNALNEALVIDLDVLLSELQSSSWCRALVLTGAGTAFCAGGDMDDNVDAEPDPVAAIARHRCFVAAAERLATFPKPTVAAVNGHAVGAGASLSLACDEIVMHSTAKLGLIFLRVGLPPDMLSVQHLQRRVGWTVAADLLHSARMIPAAEAAELRLIHEVTDEAREAAIARATRLAALSPFAFAATKSMLREAAGGRSLGELEALMVGVAATTPEFRAATAKFRIPRPDLGATT
jgi:2-(1,2-epoxy-1,2-dihydrophenyl)acetyl-CoA isomerase